MDEWTITTLKEHLDIVLRERDKGLRDSLRTLTDSMDRIEERINLLRSDHVTREEVTDIKYAMGQSKGARTAFIAFLSIALTLIAITLGAMYDKQLTHKDVSDQISRESPWAADRPILESRLTEIEKQIALLLVGERK